MRLRDGERISRRAILQAAGIAAPLLAVPRMARAARLLPAAQDDGAPLAIDLTSEPATLDPARVYDNDGWSIVHSIYDSLVQIGSGGKLEMVLAKSMTQTDPLLWEIELRPDITFHNGEPLDAAAVAFSIAHIVDPETKSQVAGNFAVIEKVEEVDPLHLRLHLSAPAPWLPAQIAPWLAILPPVYAADPANDFAANPVGTGPYRFTRWDRGSKIALARNDGYFGDTAKGSPIAANVEFRFVPDGTTRATDVISGTSQIVNALPFDELEAVQQSAQVIAEPIVGCAFVRIPTDVAPFDDPWVRQALNHAVDVDAIIAGLIGGHGQRLASFFPPGGMGFDEQLAPLAYDPDLARQLLAEAGYPDGFSTRLAYTSSEREDLIGAIAGQLAAVGVAVEQEPVEIATFNATFTDPEAAPLRFLTWRPMFDPYTLLSLLVSNTGFLSRYDDPDAQALIDAGAVEADPAAREGIYRKLGKVLQDSPAGIYLWNLTAFYGVSHDAPAWTPRPDDWILPLAVKKA